MKCPLLIAAAITHNEKIEDSAVQCGAQECAWWDRDRNQCVALSLYEELRLLVGAAGMIAERLSLGAKSHGK